MRSFAANTSCTNAANKDKADFLVSPLSWSAESTTPTMIEINSNNFLLNNSHNYFNIFNSIIIFYNNNNQSVHCKINFKRPYKSIVCVLEILKLMIVFLSRNATRQNVLYVAKNTLLIAKVAWFTKRFETRK